MGEEFFTVLPVTEARKKLDDYLPVELRSSERRPLLECLGRRLARPVLSQENVPGFARSTVDGFAVRARDTFGATEGAPAYLRIIGEVRMGEVPECRVGAGEAVRVATGAMLPEGADAAVMIEHTEPLGNGEIEVIRPVGPGENVILPDEDISSGEEIFPTNHLLRPQDLGFLAAVGELELEVWAPLVVGIISTGDEVVPPEAKPRPGQVRDINSYTLAGKVLECGGKPVLYGLVKDDPEMLHQVLRQALEETDIVVVSGGSSVGTRDLTTDVISGLGKPGLVFHGLAIRPGKPTMGAVVGKKPVFGLPGHPAAALISFDLLVAPLLKFGSYRGIKPAALPVPALLSRSLASAPGREDFIRVKLRSKDGKLWADPLLGKSGLLSPMVRGDGIFRIPLEKEGVAAGSEVDVYLFGTDYVL
ncbi:MAG: Molybdopterin biosynthesis protein MoeA [Thermoanaerobacterales bacterium 50_218]|nr:MAG: Molybdopterin biosynthesis protein MoeA [Thermoanaerobacterales bacterium 50_218]HAA89641.1 molybdopterin molybdenumtransferase MoeA [Peptococcaceae bacterium]